MARSVLNHPLQMRFNDLYNIYRGVDPSQLDSLHLGGDGVWELTVDLAEFDHYLIGLETATMLGGWEALADEATMADANVTVDDRRRRIYIRKYMSAYFRDGYFFRASLSGTELMKRLSAELRKALPFLEDSDYETLVRRLFKRIDFDDSTNRPLFGKIGASGFVTRGGERYKVPSIEAKWVPAGEPVVSVSQIDYVAVGADLVRVMLHAVFDAHDQLPAVSTATGVALPEGYALSINDPETTKVDEEEFGKVERRANEVENVVGTAVGRLIRGAAWISLNNEALATAIETSVGVASRKFAEKATWCWYACGFDGGGAKGDYLAVTSGSAMTLRITVTGPPASLAPGDAPWR
jgi:hypothetical protein